MQEKIMKLLSKNARITRQEMANRLNTTIPEIERHIEELESEQVILGYHTVINEGSPRVERRVRAIIEVRISPRRENRYDDVAKRISRFSEVYGVCMISGEYDLSVQVDGDNIQEIASFVASKLSTIDGVISCATHFILKKYKESGFLYEKEEEHERLKVSP